MPIVVTESVTQITSGAPLIVPNSRYLSFEMQASHIIGVSVSPFTGAQQAYEWPGAFWQAKASFPPMYREQAADWQAFFISCKGKLNPFNLGDPLAALPRGSVAGVGNVTLDGSQLQGSSLLSTWGWTAGQTNILRKMDYFQIPRNYLTSPSAFTETGWFLDGTPPTITPDIIAAPQAGIAADRIVFPAANSSVGQTFFSAPGVAGGQTFIFSVWLKVGSGTTTVRLYLQDRIPDSPPDYQSTTLDAALTTTWQRFTLSRTMREGIDHVAVAITNSNDFAAKTIYAWGASAYSLTQDARLYTVLDDVNSDSDQNALLDIFPPLRSGGSNIEGSPIITTSPVGLFRMSKNDTGWLEDNNKHWRDMSFEAVEVLP